MTSDLHPHRHQRAPPKISWLKIPLVIGVIFIVAPVLQLVLLLYWLIMMFHQSNCFGFIALDLVLFNCSDLVQYQLLTSDYQFADFTDELKRISADFHEYKLGYEASVSILVLVHCVFAASGLFLLLGSLRENKMFLIPWLIVGKILMLWLLTSSVAIIFIEAKLFGVGSSVFGLLSILSLCLAVTQFYFVTMVRRLYESLDRPPYQRKSERLRRMFGTIIDTLPDKTHTASRTTRGTDNQAFEQEYVPMQHFSIAKVHHHQPDNNRTSEGLALDCSKL